MKRSVRAGVGLVTAATVTLAIGLLSQVPYRAASDDTARIRLAWRIRGARAEVCRQLTQEELAGIPQHMRRTEVCEGRVVPYRLSVELGDTVVLGELVMASGAKSDSPLYVSREFAVLPGMVRVFISFIRDGDVGKEAVESFAPDTLEYQDALDLKPGQVAVITYDAEQRRLVLMGGGDTGSE